MQVLPINTVSIPSSASSSSVGNVSSSSRDIAASTLTPSVTVSLSNSNKADALKNIAVPPVYSRVSVGASNTNQLSPSRNSTERPSIEIVSGQESDPEISQIGVEANDRVISENAENSEDEQQGAEQADQNSAVNAQSGQREEQKADPGQLTEEQLEVVQALQARDREVRAHEQAHKAVAGALAGAVSYTFQSAPNGQRYAVGGEVPIDASPISGDPAATIRKMTTVKAAATAPVDPSPQDQSVAATASRIMAEARKELAAETIANQNAGASEEGDSSESATTSESTVSSAESQASLNSEYEKVIAPLESKSVQIDERI